MKRHVLILVEGPTEEQFFKDVVNPYHNSLFFTPIILTNKRFSSGKKLTGGDVKWPKIERELQRIINSRGNALVATFFDLYGTDWSVVGDSKTLTDGAKRSTIIEQFMLTHFASEAFIPHIQPYEFEALCFSDERGFSNTEFAPEQKQQLNSIVSEYDNPETINDSPVTSPSHRIKRIIPSYQKVLDGKFICFDIGLPRIRERCPHFNAWLTTLEATTLG